MIVVDASAVVELLLGGERADPVLSCFAEHEGGLHAPSLVDVEALQVLRRMESSGVMGSARAHAATEVLQDLPVSRHPEEPLIPRIWQLRANLTAYDAAYVALAEALECTLFTFDAGLAGAPALPVEIRLGARDGP